MKKSDVVAGEHYVRACTKDYLQYSYGNRRVVVVSNDTFVETRRVPRSYVDRDPEFVKAHLAWALTEAFPRQTTPDEQDAARLALRKTQSAVQTRYFEEDPMRLFTPVNKAPSYGESGCLVRVVTADGTLGNFSVCPRRELKTTWARYEVEVAEQDRLRQARQRKQNEEEADRRRKVLHVQGVAAQAFAGTGVEPPYVGSYSRSVNLTLDQAIALFEKAAGVVKEGVA